MSNEISEAIFHGDDPQSLYQSMLKSINEFCVWILHQQENQQHDYVKQIADYVDANFSTPELSLDMIAEKFNLSIYMVSRMLKEYWNIGYKEYLTIKRIRYSKQLLEESSMNIADIAAASGFSDAMHFSRAFRANTGISPTQYRKITLSE